MSSGYLEELSVRYKQQIEDLQQAVRQLNEGRVALETADGEQKKEFRDVMQKLDALSAFVTKIDTEVYTMKIWVRTLIKGEVDPSGIVCLVSLGDTSYRFDSQAAEPLYIPVCID